VRPLPIPAAVVTPDNSEFFAGLEQGRLMLPRCDGCDTVIWYPRHHCPACGDSRITWFPSSGQGIIYSFTVVRRGLGEWGNVAPYVVAYVELDEGPRVLTNISPVDLASLAIGAPVEAVVDHSPDAPPVLRFQLR
jgi:uncharacterized protein